MYLFWKLMSDDSNTCTPCVFFFSFFLVLLIFNHLVSCLLACLVISIENWLLSVKNCSWPYMIYPWLEKAPEKAMAPHSSTRAWKIPWMEEPGRLQSMGYWRVWQDRATSLSLFAFVHWRRKWQPLQCSCLENSRDGGAWWAVIYGVTQSWTWLKRLSSSIQP